MSSWHTMLGMGRSAGLVLGAVAAAMLAGGCAHKQPRPAPITNPATTQTPPAPVPTPTNQPAVAIVVPMVDRSEQIRSACLDGRRMICGRVLEITNGGLIVESGYTGLDREPLNRSWVIPGNVSVTLDQNAIEGKTPGSYCYGTVFVTDLPKRGAPPIHKYDYLLLLGYPAGQYEYVPVPPIKKTIRKFTGTLEMAVILNLQAEGK